LFALILGRLQKLTARQTPLEREDPTLTPKPIATVILS
jgi:hypothetical protein